MIEPLPIRTSAFVGALDPRARVLAAVLFSVTVALLDRPDALGLALIVSVLSLVWGRLALRPVLRRLMLVNGFNLFLWIILPLSAGGELLLVDSAMPLSLDGLRMALGISLKSNSILIFLQVFLLSLPLSTLGEALYRLAVPEKLILLLLLTYRYIFVFDVEFRRLMRSARVRGFEPGTNLHSYRTFGYLVGMLLVRAFGRAERVRFAMELRGFSGRFHQIIEFRPGLSDGLFLAAVTAIALGLGVLQWI